MRIVKMSLMVAVLGCAAADETDPARLSDVETVDRAVINGFSTSDADNFHNVAVYHGTERPCSGFHLGRGWVLTAKHCTDDVPLSQMRVSTKAAPGLSPPSGSYSFSTNGLQTHPSLDVALLYSRNLALGTAASAKQWHRRELWLAPSSTLVNRALVTHGYGVFTAGVNSTAGVLRWAQLTVVDSTPTTINLEANASGQVLCNGDSGGASKLPVAFPGESGDFYASVHTNSGCLNGSMDVPLSAFSDWLMDVVGFVTIRRLYDNNDLSLRRYLDVAQNNPASGTLVHMWESSGTSAQRWHYNSVTQQIRNVNGKCLDVQWNDPANGTPVWMWDCSDSPAQKWTFHSDLSIRNANGKCLDVENGSTSLGTKVQIWDCNGGPNQRWAASLSN